LSFLSDRSSVFWRALAAGWQAKWTQSAPVSAVLSTTDVPFMPQLLAPARVSRRHTLSALAALTATAALPVSANAQQLALATAVNRVARLRALSQRVTKAYTQIVLSVTPEDSQRVLAAAQRVIEANLAEVSRAPLSGDVQAAFARAKSDAEKLLALARTKPDAARLPELNAAAEAMLQSADRATVALEGGKTQARIINIAGRKRMLSQRIAKAYMLAQAGVDASAMNKQITDARAEFNQGLTALENSPVSTEAIRTQLQLARAQWLMYQAALDGRNPETARRDVATTSERLLELMDELTTRYEVAMRDVLGAVSAYREVYAGDAGSSRA
jgi:hypothetical protein